MKPDGKTDGLHLEAISIGLEDGTLLSAQAADGLCVVIGEDIGG